MDALASLAGYQATVSLVNDFIHVFSSRAELQAATNATTCSVNCLLGPTWSGLLLLLEHFVSRDKLIGQYFSSDALVGMCIEA